MTKHLEILKVVSRKDRLELIRDHRMVVLIILILMLALASILSSYERLGRYSVDRAIATQQERQSWLSQGDRDPHSAAHFAQWTFRPLVPTSLLDPFAIDYAGTAIWLEAHARNPAAVRPVESRASSLDVGQLSIGWILQVIAPVLAFLLGSGVISKEKQNGTLRLMVANGIAPKAIFIAKLQSLFLTILLIVSPILIVGLIAVLNVPTDFTLDSAIRFSLWTLFHVAWLGLAVCLAVAVSALSGTQARSVMILLSIWVVAVLLIPRAISGTAEVLYPTPSGAKFWAQVRSDINNGINNSGDRKQREEALEKELFAKYNVVSRDQLPISFRGAVLDANERFGNTVFEKHYLALENIYSQQRSLIRFGGLLTPFISLQNISAALAGSDNHHLNHFNTQAEMERQRVVNALNRDLMLHSVGESNYTADENLWASFEVFEPVNMPVIEAVRGIVIDVIIMFTWLCIVIFILVRAKTRLSNEFGQ